MDREFLDRVVRVFHDAGHVRWPEIPHGNHGTADPIVFWMFGMLDGIRLTYDYPNVAARVDRRTFDRDKDQATHRAVDYIAGQLADLGKKTPTHFDCDEDYEAWLTKRLAGVIMEPVTPAPIAPVDIDFDTGKITWDLWTPPPPIDYDEWMDRGAD